MIRRLMIYHHYDVNELVDDHIVYQLSAYHEALIDIIFITNSPVSKLEQAKIMPYVKEICLRANRGFDWGAWAEIISTRGNELLASYAELILTNCTCYGPFFKISDLFSQMAARNCDFWSLTFHPQGLGFPEHGQSYFLCCNSKVFNSGCFRTFFINIGDFKCYWDAVWKGEIAFHANLVAAKFVYATAICHDTNIASAQANIFSLAVAQRLLFTQQIPLVKIKAFLSEDRTNQSVALASFAEVLSNAGSTYPCELIKNHLSRVVAEQSCYGKSFCAFSWRDGIIRFFSQHLGHLFSIFSYITIILRCKRYGIATSHVHIKGC